ncbi:MAG TPA: hypothetical protein VFZ09_51205 [Archangium sp.]|uniref:hypothetical protein n=1 Tax=Archangium sp. TaxID=1872627 RepID=UPI002E31FD63|nr:hypothetical protein [Archangium sp.]HEX5754656.1 hypothetical protein [Archangium sp.]
MRVPTRTSGPEGPRIPWVNRPESPSPTVSLARFARPRNASVDGNTVQVRP